MDAKLDPKALAENGDVDMDDREAVQSVTKDMVRDYVVAQDELPPESAGPFAVWLNENWNNWNEDGDLTNGDVIEGALAFWRGE